MKTKTIVAALATLGVMTAPAFGQPIHADGTDMISQARNISGIYAGSYLCQDGEHGFYLELVVDVVPGADRFGLAFSGILGFFPVLAGRDGDFAHVAGSFAVTGDIDLEGRIVATPGEWLVMPDGYGAAHLEGVLTRRDDRAWQITGKPVIPGNADFCSDLVATRFLP